MGLSSQWKMDTYYNPADGPSKPQPSMGIHVNVGGGSDCGDAPNTTPRQSDLFLLCDPKATTRFAGIMKITESDPVTQTKTPCHYYFAPLSSDKFCPGTSAGGSGGFDMGWVFVIIVLVGLFLYFVIGIIVLKFAMHKEGVEIVPQHEFWTALPSLVIDGLKYTFCCVPCKGGGSYTEV